MTEKSNSMLVHCGSCKHEWFAFKLPMPLFDAAELATKIRCPECRKPSIQIYYGPAPVDKINTSAERVKKTGES